MIFSIVLTASSLTTVVSESACCASVRTARWTASLASSDLGLNSRVSSAENSSSCASAGACWAAWVSFAMAMLPLLLRVGRLRRLPERLQQFRILQHLLDELLGA